MAIQNDTDIIINHLKQNACKLAPAPLRGKIRAAGYIRLSSIGGASSKGVPLG